MHDQTEKELSFVIWEMTAQESLSDPQIYAKAMEHLRWLDRQTRADRRSFLRLIEGGRT
jgi:hypothetical protein